MVVKKEIKIDISSHIEKGDELIKMITKLKSDKKLIFYIYDSLKGFDLIMSVIGKDKLLEYFKVYMKNSKEKQKNYSKFVSFISDKEGKTFFYKLRKIYTGIINNYDSIKFGIQSHHFGSEEIYLRETLEKIKSILESLGELKIKGNFININLSFLNGINSNLDFKFNNIQLEEIIFYERLNELDEETNDENLLPFFHLLNTLIDELINTEERVVEMINENKNSIQKDIDKLYLNKEYIEKESITNAKKEIKDLLKVKNITELNNLSDKNIAILNNIEKNKSLSQSIIIKDIETLENKFYELEKII